MLDLSNSVILPREDFMELSLAIQPPASTRERVATTIQTSTVCMGMALAFGAGSWIWYKAMAKLEDKKLENRLTEIEEIERNKRTDKL